jgi:GMP synthase-like glutamine amidotransferase
MAETSPILVFHHMPAEHPGYLFDLLRAGGIPFRILRLDLGEPIPDLGSFRALWVLGGPMDVWEVDRHPWLIEEKRAIREAVLERGMAYFGVCLGHQLLAEALGGEVGPADEPEIGVFDIELNRSGLAHPLLLGLPPALPLLQWHFAEVKTIPRHVDILARSAACPIHGIALDDRVLGLQSHIEVNLETVREWLRSPAALLQLEQQQGPDAAAVFERKVHQQMDAFNRAAAALCRNLVNALD